MKWWWVFSFLAIAVFTAPVAAKPRYPFPSTPDEVGQNDRDLDDSIRAIVISSRTLPSGSTNYIQNTSSLQGGSTFYVSSGTVNSFTAQSATFTVIRAPGINYQITTSTPLTQIQRTTTSATYSSTFVTSTYTATVPTSRVAIFASESVGASGVAGTVCGARIYRDATPIAITGDQTVVVDDSATESDSTLSLFAVDAPNDTNAHVYEIRFARNGGTGTCVANTTGGGGNGGHMILLEFSK